MKKRAYQQKIAKHTTLLNRGRSIVKLAKVNGCTTYYIPGGPIAVASHPPRQKGLLLGRGRDWGSGFSHETVCRRDQRAHPGN
jgi:hypothetical protein